MNTLQTKKIFKYIIFITFTIYACRNIDQPINWLTIENENIIQKVNVNTDFSLTYDDLIDELKLIKLETNKESTIGSISKLLFFNELLFVVDKQHTKSVFIFDMNGNYLSKVNAKGKGPGEYINMWDVELDKKNKHIVVLDLHGKKMLHYDFNGKYIKSVNTAFSFSEFKIDNNENILCFNGREFNYRMKEQEFKNCQILFTNSNGKILQAGFRYRFTNKNFRWSPRRILSDFNSNFYYTPKWSDTIYSINSERAIPSYQINFDGKGLINPPNDITSEKFDKLITEKIFFNGEFFELKENVFFLFDSPKGLIQILYSKKNNKSYKIINETDKPLNAFLHNVPLNIYGNDRIVTALSPIEIISNKDFLKLDKRTEVTKELFSNLSYSGNPFLVFYKIKVPK